MQHETKHKTVQRIMDFPHDFTIRTKQWLGDEYALLEKALQEVSPISIRLNPFKQMAQTVEYERVKWCKTGYYLHERPFFTFDPLFHAGCYYVQEASSMFLEQAVSQHISTPVICLDLCASPGGKSTHLLNLLPDNSLLVSNEVIHHRASVLRENLIKWGSPFNVVTCNTPQEIGKLTHLFDVIVADLPCSGEGMFRKDRNSRNEWSIANIRLCAARQRRIIHDVWESLKPGGLLVYSTCTFNREENEENIRHLIKHLNAEVIPVSVDADWNISQAIDESFPVYRFYPHKIKGEGFCLTLLKKPDGKRKTIQVKNAQLKNPSHPLREADKRMSYIREMLDHENRFHIVIDKNIQAIPSSHHTTCQLLSHYLCVLSACIWVGDIKGNDFIPSPALALNSCFRNDVFPSIELTLEESIRYLQKEALVLPSAVPNGYVVVKYNNSPLGFVKNIGNRANNLFPHEWRIRKRLTDVNFG